MGVRELKQESIIADNAVNLNSDLMRETCERFKIAHRNSTIYRPQMNGAVEAANKNIKKILRKIVGSHRQCCNTCRGGNTIFKDYLRGWSGRCKMDRSKHEHLMFIDEKRMDAVCHGQLYQNKMTKAFNKKVKPRQFTLGQLVLKKIFPHQGEVKGKFAPKWQGPYMVRRVLWRSSNHSGNGR
ncbi:uncharacterized protein LOC125827307 [Solanum verrucosum]|uniref:uncharacterized protein LOC125827307 n=1 Tax=Solanum verrucosum TaxID=315347 RepID=UPI0020D0B594|nr:uncharacterized protein LOC125827307 [Solanum verrucosum]